MKKNMKLPIKVFVDKPPLGGVGQNTLIWIFIQKGHSKEFTDEIITHEETHFWQQVELGFVLMWVLYVLFYLIMYMRYGSHHSASWNIPFEREAYVNDRNPNYIKERKPYAWVKYIFYRKISPIDRDEKTTT